MTNRVYAMHVINDTAVNVCDSMVSDCHQVDLFVRIEQIKVADIPLSDAS